MIKYVFALIVSLILAGCGNSHNILLRTNSVPPLFFKMTDKQTMDNFYFDTQKYAFKFPSSKESDFTQRGGWTGMTSNDGHGITLSFKDGTGYNIDFLCDYYPHKVTERTRAIENGTIKFRPQRTIVKRGKKYIIDINTHIEHYGTENYPCVVSSSEIHYEKYGNKYIIGYRCYKFNPDKTKYIKVHIRLSYSKPINPTLAKQYTYADLKRRAKRMLDSLYIKDNW